MGMDPTLDRPQEAASGQDSVSLVVVQGPRAKVYLRTLLILVGLMAAGAFWLAYEVRSFGFKTEMQLVRIANKP